MNLLLRNLKKIARKEERLEQLKKKLAKELQDKKEFELMKINYLKQHIRYVRFYRDAGLNIYRTFY